MSDDRGMLKLQVIHKGNGVCRASRWRVVLQTMGLILEVWVVDIKLYKGGAARSLTDSPYPTISIRSVVSASRSARRLLLTDRLRSLAIPSPPMKESAIATRT